MPFTTLLQEQYKDRNGNNIAATSVQYLAPYKYIFDGFYEWECGGCKVKHSSRACGWPIAGQVLVCEKTEKDPGCGKLNLLVKTNVTELDEAFGLMNESKRIVDELKKERDNIHLKVQHLARERLGYITTPLRNLLAEIEKGPPEPPSQNGVAVQT